MGCDCWILPNPKAAFPFLGFHFHEGCYPSLADLLMQLAPPLTSPFRQLVN